jgi:hypothetical protein
MKNSRMIISVALLCLAGCNVKQSGQLDVNRELDYCRS